MRSQEANKRSFVTLSGVAPNPASAPDGFAAGEKQLRCKP